MKKKKYLCFFLFFFLILGSLFILKRGEGDFYSNDEKRIQNFIAQRESISLPTSLFPEEKETFRKGKRVVSKDSMLYFLRDDTICAYTKEKETITQKSYDSFYPITMHLYEDYLYIFGVKGIKEYIVLDEHFAFPYEKYECVLKIVSVKNLVEVRNILFSHAFYQSSYLYKGKLFFSLGTMDLVNDEDEFRYPTYQDSFSSIPITMSKEEIFLPKKGELVYAMTMIGSLSLQIPFAKINWKGYLGMLSEVSFTPSYFYLTSYTYNEESYSHFYFFHTYSFAYYGSISLKGALYVESASQIDNYDFYVFLTEVHEEKIEHYFYQFSLSDFRLLYKKKIREEGAIREIQFANQCAYISFYEESCFYLIRFQNLYEKQWIKKENVDVSCFLTIDDEEIFTLERKKEKEDFFYQFVTYHPQTLTQKMTYIWKQKEVYLYKEWGEEMFLENEDYCFFLGANREENSLFVFHKVPAFSYGFTHGFQREYILDFFLEKDVLYCIGNESLFLFKLPSFTYKALSFSAF